MTDNKKKLVYISHPSGGLEENTKKIEDIVNKLLDNDDIFNKYCIVSPVHCYGFMYDTYEKQYLKGLQFCIDLLTHCDLMLLCGEWEKSRGCTAERQKCIENNIPFIEVRDVEALDKILESGSLE